MSDPVAVDAGLMADVPRPAAWVDFTAAGVVRFWTADWHRAHRETKAGRSMQPLYDSAALHAAEERGAERMRGRAAKVADDDDGLWSALRPEYGPRVAERIAAAIRALPLSETEK